VLLRLHKLALWLRPVLPLCYLLGFAGLVLAVIGLLRNNTGDADLSLGLGLAMWALLLFAYIRLFQSIPPPVLPQDALLDRLRSRIQLMLYHVLALAMLLVGAALIAMSVKLLTASKG
jgi:hypothetical protein